MKGAFRYMPHRKLTESEYFELQAQYERTPAIGDSIGGTGEHMQLRYLLRKYGFSPSSRRGAEIDLAEELLSNGWVTT